MDKGGEVPYPRLLVAAVFEMLFARTTALEEVGKVAFDGMLPAVVVVEARIALVPILHIRHPSKMCLLP